MTEENQNDDSVRNNRRSTATLISLPDELAEWADQNQELILRVQDSLADTYVTLTEEQLWETIATACAPPEDSAKWVRAKANLRAAQDRWDDLYSPEKKPLGLIGSALDSDETNSVREQYAFSLAHFTVINEGLRQREDLGRLLSVLLVQKRMLELSTDRTHHLLEATTSFAEADSLRGEFREAARESSARQDSSNLADIFRLHAKSFFTRKKASRNEPAPSSPET